MTVFQAFILGLVQGVTEFLPISSSGHLVLTPYLLNWDIPKEQVFVFDVLVQIGTLVAVIIYFRKDLWSVLSVTSSVLGQKGSFQKPEVRMGVYLILASIPAFFVGVMLKSSVEMAFSNPKFTVLSLIFTALLLILAEQVGKHTKKLTQINWQDALVMGIFQAVSLFPGVSRSGSTISGGMLRGLDRPSAARFSFLMAIPVMVGAGTVAAIDLFATAGLGEFIFPLLVGLMTAAIVGYLSIHWLLRFLANHPLYYFSIYLIALTTLILVLK
ncbi:MAG TPA: undecaprenyl-diphosphatase UppP [Anaerolineales bacterium]|jgi:undecaprenyl-diphosphatase|nr:undecaprenyl-diphosphatase UppP [Anaerolineales bacterium]